MKPAVLFLAVAVLMLLPVQRTEAATNVITQAKNNKMSTGNFVKNSKGLRYRYKNGTYAKNKWHMIDGKVYYFQASGYAAKSWFTYQKKTYYADKDGKVYAGKFLTKGTKKYYLKSNGIRAEKEWIKKNGKYYYFGSKGVMAVKSQVPSGGKYYYVGADGTRKFNCWVTQKGKRYYFGKTGVRYQNKWVKYKGKYLYLGKTGAMAVNCWVGSYYVGADGARKMNCYVGGYYLDATGRRTKVKKFGGDYLIVGDSRIVGMDSAVAAKNAKFIGKVSMGYNWLKSNAGPEVKQYLAGNPKLKVVFAFGVNDLGNITQYISYYKSLMREYPKTEFYFTAVNPVNEPLALSKGYQVKNSQIKAFNTKLKSAFGSKYINTYSYLVKNKFGSSDGVHYTADTYRKLYKYITGKIA